MASNIDIKRRMKSINSTMQITKAMKLVSAAKLRRAKDLAAQTEDYFDSLIEIISGVATNIDEANKYVNISPDNKKVLYVVVTADRGMCGAYNTNMVKEVVRHFKESNINEASAILIGTKGKEVLERGGIKVIKSYEMISESPNYTSAKEIGAAARKMFEDGVIDTVYTGYAHFKSALQQIPTIQQILPLGGDIGKSDKKKNSAGIDFAPNIEEVMEWVLKKYISNMVYQAMVQASASQQGARMTAMDSATENATEMIDNLTLTFNRARQAAITQEITEIVSGAEAIK